MKLVLTLMVFRIDVTWAYLFHVRNDDSSFFLLRFHVICTVTLFLVGNPKLAKRKLLRRCLLDCLEEFGG